MYLYCNVFKWFWMHILVFIHCSHIFFLWSFLKFARIAGNYKEWNKHLKMMAWIAKHYWLVCNFLTYLNWQTSLNNQKSQPIATENQILKFELKMKA